jgi:glutamate/tyrosine decarboxylase-like PLP-dependent enzyme
VTDDDDRAAIAALEAVSRELEPGAEARADLRDRVIAYGEAFYRRVEHLAYSGDKTVAREIGELPIGEEPRDLDALLGVVERAVDTAGINTSSGGHLGYIPGGGLYASALGDYMAAVTNRYAGVRYASPGAVEMEEAVLGWMAGLVGMPEGWGGNLTSGGSIANLMGIVAAREASGLRAQGYARAVVYATTHVHHCVDKALRISGLGEVVRREVAMDDGYRMDSAALAETIASDRAAGLTPLMVVASAGTTDVGAIDPLEAIGEMCREQELWFHVDAAYGGFFLLCEELAPKLRGMALADSVVLDPHKGLFLPFGSGAVLVRDKATLLRSHSYHANYMQEAAGDQTLALASPGDLSPEFSKHFRGPRLWLPLMLHGVAPFRACLDEKRALALYFRRAVAALGFEVGPTPDLTVVTYRWVPRSGDANPFNERLVQAILDDGRIFVSSTKVDDTFILRAAFLSFRTRLHHVDTYLEILRDKVALLEE